MTSYYIELAETLLASGFRRNATEATMIAIALGTWAAFAKLLPGVPCSLEPTDALQRLYYENFINGEAYDVLGRCADGDPVTTDEIEAVAKALADLAAVEL